MAAADTVAEPEAGNVVADEAGGGEQGTVGGHGGQDGGEDPGIVVAMLAGSRTATLMRTIWSRG